MEIEEGDLVLCTVEKVERTVVFVKINLNREEVDGSIVMSEIAPGRIRNIRDYVVPKKKIVCKVLRISSRGNIELSLRRVTPKERKEVTEQHKQERNYSNMLKSILGKKAEEIIKKILEKERIFDFFESIGENPEKLEKTFGKTDAKKILEILKTQKKKSAVIKKEISLKFSSSNGLSLIKDIFADLKSVEIKYISAGKYTIKSEAEDIKKADKNLKEVLEKIEKRVKNSEGEFSII